MVIGIEVVSGSFWSLIVILLSKRFDFSWIFACLQLFCLV